MGKFLDFIAGEMRLRNLSPKTIKAYCHAIEKLYKQASAAPALKRKPLFIPCATATSAPPSAIPA